jgi:hypothetical protein
MGFGQIIFLLGIAGVVGPILVHLLVRPRFKRIPYTMVDFLEVSQKQSKATRRLRELLILLIRCAIIALMAFMFAEPFLRLRGEVVDHPERHFIVVDNSLSMTYQDRGRSHLDRALAKTVQYVKTHQTAPATFDVYDFCGGRYGTKLEAVAAVDVLKRIAATARKADLTDLSSAVRAAVEKHEDTFVYLVSDFTSAAVQALEQCQAIDGLQDINYDVIAAGKPTNALVRNARVLRYRDGIVELLVEVENSGSAPQRRILDASADGKNGVVAVAGDTASELEPSSSAEYVLQLQLDSLPSTNSAPSPQGGVHQERTELVLGDDFLPVEIVLSPPDPLVVDDKYFLGIQIECRTQQRVLINGRTERQGFLIRKALEAISWAEFDNNMLIRQNQRPTLDRTRLDNSDILICGHITRELGQNIDNIEDFIAKGGTAVFFVSRDMDLPTVQRMYDAGVIGARPTERIDDRHVLSGQWPSDSVFTYAGLDVDIARAARSYNLDEMPLWSHFACRKSPETKCFWPVDTGHSLVYAAAHGAGKSLLINTSMDDSMSSLTKRAVVIPLCRLILGCGSVAYGYGFPAEEEVTLPVFDFERGVHQADQSIWVIDPAGNKHKVPVTGSNLTGHYPEQTGWLRTLSQPVCYAGINPVVGETNLNICEQAEIDRLLAGLSGAGRQSNKIDAATTSDTYATDASHRKRPLWRWLAWTIIVLVLAEGFLTNRIKK